MKKWKVNWSGAIRAFPGLEGLITNFTELEQHAKEQVAHIEQSVLAYFHQHPDTNGSLAIDASAELHGEHSATVTLAVIPKVTEVPIGGERIDEPPLEPVADPAADQSGERDGSKNTDEHFVIQAQGNGVSLVFGPAADQTFNTVDAAEIALAAVKDARLGDTPIKTVHQVTAEQVQTLQIEGLSA